jgi:hypothetical protein
MTESAAPAHGTGFTLPVWVWLTLWMLLGVGIPVLAHYTVRGVVNPWHAALSFFLAVNILICIWEISLGAQIGEIERWHHDPEGRRERPRDVGNGWSTLLPSLFFLVGMTAGFVPAVVLGLVGAFLFYQKLYCTCLYFFSYFFNRRYEGHPVARLIPIVGGSNGVWLVFPAVGLYVCIRLILENRYDLLWS